MRILLVVIFLIFCASVSAWERTQTTINHVQVDEINEYFYITVGNTAETVSGCDQGWGKSNWLGFKIEPNNDAQKTLISMAIAAYMSGKLVDVGSSITGCINGAPVAHLGYIRIGNYR